MNPLLMLLLQQMAGNQNTQQNPLMALLGGNQQQDSTQQLISLLGGVTGQQSNDINPQLLQMLMGTQQPQQNQNGGIQQLMQLLGGQQPQNQNSGDLSKLLETLQGQKKEKTDLEKLAEMLSGSSGKNENQDDDVLARLQKQFNQKNEQEDSVAELSEAIEFSHSFDKFISENEEMLPDWFDVNQVKEDVEKWAKTPVERSQGLAAATVRAFFKNEEMMDLLEERDRKSVQEQVLKDGIKSHEIDRKMAWPLIERAVFNKTKLSEGGKEVPTGKDESAIQKYSSIFEQGQKSESTESNAA